MFNRLSFTDNESCILFNYNHFFFCCFLSVLNNITEAEVNIEAIFKVFSENSEGKQIANSEVLFHAVDLNTQTIMTSNEVLR